MNVKGSIIAFSVIALIALIEPVAFSQTKHNTKDNNANLSDSVSYLSAPLQFNGFYAGLGIGEQISQVKIKTTIQQFVVGSSDNTILSNPNINSPSFLINVLLGYAHVIHRYFYLGFEGRVSFEHIRAKNDIEFQERLSSFFLARKERASVNNEYLLAIKPGIFLPSRTLLYGVFGASFAKISFITSANYSQVVGNFVSAKTSTYKAQYNTGLTLGLGLERYLTEKLSAKFEYDFVDYYTVLSNESVTSAVSNAGAGSFLRAINNHLKVQMNKVMIGINYHF